MACSNCDKPKVFSRGLCSGCYSRLRRNGSLDRRNVVKIKVCSVPKCGKPTLARNLCQTHYNRASHPLKAMWKLLRGAHSEAYPAKWNDFAGFLADVGERPSPKHQLRRINEALPHSASNVKWLPPIKAANDNWAAPETKEAYARAWSLNNKFGLSVDEFDSMLAAQGGGCACCGGVETHRYASGKTKALSVDHDHATGDVRGLLCVKCNRAIGYFDDSPLRMRAAADYLECHQSPQSIVPTAGLSAGFLF